MHTAPLFQRRGFGRAILLRFEGRAVELEYRRVRLDTTARQAAARHLYETAGDLETARLPGLGAHEDILYDKTLDDG